MTRVWIAVGLGTALGIWIAALIAIMQIEFELPTFPTFP